MSISNRVCDGLPQRPMSRLARPKEPDALFVEHEIVLRRPFLAQLSFT